MTRTKIKSFKNGDIVNVSVTGRKDEVCGINGTVIGKCVTKPLWSDTRRTMYLVNLPHSIEYANIAMTTSIIVADPFNMFLVQEATSDPTATYRSGDES